MSSSEIQKEVKDEQPSFLNRIQPFNSYIFMLIVALCNLVILQ